MKWETRALWLWLWAVMEVRGELCRSMPRKEAATSVWSLKPSQVDVVLALGDSISAAFGAAGRRGGLHEYRGRSWSIGGDDNATTLPNFIKQHNPQLQGYAVGRREVSVCWGSVCLDRHVPKYDVLNGALSGAMLHNVLKEELDYVFQEMEERKIDIDNTWKVLTLFVGGNDVCVACHPWRKLDGDAWEHDLRTVLTIIRDRLPRTFVNVVELFNVSRIYEAGEDDPYCRTVRRYFFIECECAFGPEADHYRARMDELTAIYNAKTREVVQEFLQFKNDTFAVSLHTFTRDFDVSKLPRGMISDLDCFHPSEASHAISAIALWNSMLTPPDKRGFNVPVDIVPFCPDEESYFHAGMAM